MTGLPTDYNARKELPLFDFLMGYFPDAFIEVVRVAVAGNLQHNPGEKLHWARGKSTDQMNTAFRHMFDHGRGNLRDIDGCYHLAKSIWRLSAELQLTLEREAQKEQPQEQPRVPRLTAEDRDVVRIVERRATKEVPVTGSRVEEGLSHVDLPQSRPAEPLPKPLDDLPWEVAADLREQQKAAQDLLRREAHLATLRCGTPALHDAGLGDARDDGA